ncbi:hypothetical protein V8B97DRAFT_1864919 [Scleroderma yunnanense]
MDPGEAQRTQQQQRSSIPSFLFIIFLLFMLTNHSGDEFLARNHYQDALRSLTFQLSNFTAWVNGSESDFIMPNRHPATATLVESHMTFGSRLDPSTASYFPNITGFIRGDLDFYNISLPNLDGTDVPWKSYAQSYMADSNVTEVTSYSETWNWNATQKVSWSIIDRAMIKGENGTDDMAVVHGRIDLADWQSGTETRLEFEGVHILANGSIYGFAEPGGRHIDIRYLPAIVPEELYNDTSRLVQLEIQSRIDKVKQMIDAGVIDQESSDSNSGIHGNCGFLVFAQIEPSMISEELMRDVESELQKPTGKWTPEVFPLRMNGVLISRECGILYRLHNAVGLRSQLFFRKVTTYAGVSAVVYLILLTLLTRQIERSHTSASLSRLSAWTFYTQAIVDAVSFAGHITFAILANGRPSLALVAPAFIACVLFSLEAQHAILINQVQAPEDAINLPPPPRPSPQPPQSATLNPDDAEPAPTTAAPPRHTGPSFISLFMWHLRSDPQARIWVGLFLCLTFIVRVIVSPSLALFFVGTMYSLFWLPQIIRSIRCGRSSALTAEYMIGTSICRLWFPLYFLANSTNVLDVEPRRWVYPLTAFVLFQVSMVLLQQWLGPAFFLPKRFATTQMYNYHPPLPSSMHDPEAPDQSLGDCSICMEGIHATESKQLQQVTGRLLHTVGARKSYSLAPCHHLFHTECLEKWLAVKNICPQCRRPLPPL